MTNATLSRTNAKSLQDPDLKERLQQLRQTDNYTNLYYILRTYLYLTAVIGGSIWFYHGREAVGLSWWWNMPVTLLAIVLVGAGQHQLTGITHEAAHHILFRNRLWNELASDWLCMFPLFSATHLYRLQHLAHHQFVNDPLRDPDVSQLQHSGHWLAFPLSKKEFVRTLLKQLWLPNLVRYMRVRARYNALRADQNPYLRKDRTLSRIPLRVGVLYLFGLVAMLTGLVFHGDTLLLAVVPAACWLAVMTLYALIPARWYHQSRVHAAYSTRTMTLMRITFLTGLFNGLAWVQFLTRAPAAWYFFFLWVVPIFTSFSFFMILRQLVQHGNGGRGWLTNTRVFFVHPFIRFSVFPLGQDYHLPHHLFASIPHYRLRRLHEALMQSPEYREQAVVVEGYCLPKHRPPTHPTVLDVLGPAYARSDGQEVYIDNTVLEGVRVEEKDAILTEAELSRAEATASQDRSD